MRREARSVQAMESVSDRVRWGLHYLDHNPDQGWMPFLATESAEITEVHGYLSVSSVARNSVSFAPTPCGGTTHLV